MITVDSILHAFTIPIAIAGWLALYSVTAYADAPSPETFNEPTDLVLTLSDDFLQKENSHFSSHALKPPNENSSNKFVTNKDRKGPLGMDCGMNTDPSVYTDNSITSRLSGECDLKYNY